MPCYSKNALKVTCVRACWELSSRERQCGWRVDATLWLARNCERMLLTQRSDRQRSRQRCQDWSREVNWKMAVSGGPAARIVRQLLGCLLRAEQSLLRALGLQPPPHPALAIQAPVICPSASSDFEEADNVPSFLDGIFWMAVPKSRRTIEVNRCRRRHPNKLIKEKTNIDLCPECGHMKLKHVLCGFCYDKVRYETARIRQEIKAKEGGPFRAPTVETLVLYEGEKPRPEDEGKRIIERKRIRPSWFTY